MGKWIDGRLYRTFGDHEEDPKETESEDIRRYADYVDSLTPEQFTEHQRAINAAREFEKMEAEGLI